MMDKDMKSKLEVVELIKTNNHSDCTSGNINEGSLIIQQVLDKIGGKWKGIIFFHLYQSEICRFGELKKKMPSITQRMLTVVLREMEKDGLVIRKVYAEVPPKVEYSLTSEGKDLKDIYAEIFKWGIKNNHILNKL